MIAVVDSNVLLVAVGKRSKHRPIWDKFVDGFYCLVISEDILHEYEEILIEHSAPGVAELVLETFVESPDLIFQRVFYNWNAIHVDPDDNKFFDAAVAANVDYLVTNDGHFDDAKKLSFPKVNIITADEFLDILAELHD